MHGFRLHGCTAPSKKEGYIFFFFFLFYSRWAQPDGRSLMGGACSTTKPPQRTAPVSALDGVVPAAGDASGGEEDRRGADNADNADNAEGGDATATTELTEEDAQVKATVLPGGKPPKEVAWWWDRSALSLIHISEPTRPY